MSARAKVGDAQGEGGAWAPSPSAAEMWARAPAFRTTVLCMSNVNAGQGFPPPQPTGRDGGAGGAGAEPTRPLYTKWWFWLAATFAVVALVVIAQLLINGKGGGSSAEGEPGGSELTFPEFETQKFSGTGNDDISGLNVNELAAITFTCPECEGNVIVTADSDHDGLIINEIGSWSGTVLTGMIGNTPITQFMISADSDWTLTISDANSLPVVDDATHGTGTSAFVYTGDLTAATLTHDGSQNFIVTGRGADGAYSVVNEISPYNGTVPIEPGIIAVRADGDWTFAPTSDAPMDDAESRPTKDPAPESELEFPAFETQEFSGTGDDVITGLSLDQVTAITFTCLECEGYLAVEPDSDTQQALVNTDGPWSGTVLTGLFDDAPTVELTITASSDWTLTIADANSLPVFDDATQGSGTSAFIYSGDSTAARFTHDGPYGFIVYHRAAGETDLVLNEIGPYDGTVPISRGIIWVQTMANWTFMPE